MEKSNLKTRKNRRKCTGTVSSSGLGAAARIRGNQWLRKNRVKRVSWCDEELSSSGPKHAEVEVTDPAILIRGPPSPFLRYTRDELLAIRSLPLSKCRPSCLDDSFNNSRGCWDPDRWHSDKKHTDGPGEDDRIREIPLDGHKRRSDPRERIRKEQDGIVLSPQRRSFNSGCYMPANAPPPGVTSGGVPVDIPLGGGKVGDRDNGAGGRRIGSGRILNRDTWDFRTDKQSTDLGMLDDSYSFRPGGGGPGLMRDRDDRYERRSFSREFDSRDKDISRSRDNRDMDRMGGNRSMNSRYSGNGERRRLAMANDYQREQEEPEWFSGGPTSQHDTIELRGFEDTPEEKIIRGKKLPVQQKKMGKKGGSDKDKENKDKDMDNKKKDSEQSTKDKNKSLTDSTKMNIDAPQTVDESSPRRRSTSTPVDLDKVLNAKGDCKSPIPAALQNDSSIINASVSEKISTSNKPVEPGFILEDFLNLESIPALLTNGNANEAAGSRFSQFFRRDSPPNQNRADSRRSSLQDDISIMLSDSNKYFTPINPAANSANSSGSQVANNNLLEMLQRAKTVGNETGANNEKAAGGKIHNVEELEARMRHGEGHNMSNLQDKNSNKNEEMMAFQKLLSQVTTQGNQNPAGRPVSKTQPMSILEMLNKSQQADENAARASMGNTAPGMSHQMGASAFGAPASNVQQPPQVPPELVMKLLQVQQLQRQQQQLSQLMANATAGHNFPKPPHAPNAGSSPLPNAAADIQNMFGATAAQQQYTRELLQRPEAQAIIHGLKHNKISVQHLMQQLNNPAMQQRHREMLIAILKTQGHFGHSPRNISPVGPPQNAEVMQHMMLGAQQQLRVSPLPNAYCVSPILATSPNTLTVHHPVIPPRMPSPMELQAHTRNILQGALIKKKLEEQSENFRKRQEMQRSHSPNPSNTNNSNTGAGQQSQNAAGNNSPAKHVGSPTPLAFTPTSVLRKMTAEKEPDGVSKSGGDGTSNGNVKGQDKNHGGNSASAINSRITHNQNRGGVGVAWNMNKQPQGRPIVKGGGGGISIMNQNQPQVQFASNIEFQQMQNQFANIQARSKINFPQSHNMPPNYANMQQFNSAVQQSNATSSYGPNFNNAMNRIHAQQAQQHLQRTNYQHQQLLNNPIMSSGRPKTVSGIMGFNQREGALSPTSNQLARWFSPELLAQASAGKLPPVNLAQNALSLEELERIQQSSTTVHN